MSHERKLAVILHADVAGSTRLVQLDETLAHERINRAFEQLGEVIGDYGGAVHELRGDALVAEFARASDAVTAALAYQALNRPREESHRADIKPEVRIGISLGEVVIADGTVTGPAVVLAQRIEQLAEEGGVTVTAAVREAAPSRLPFSYQDLGEQPAKGFDEPVRVYTVRGSDGLDIPGPDTPPDLEPARRDRMAYALPDIPSIAVLPLDNMTGDAGKQFLADGLTENLISVLAMSPSMLVISRNSTFAYKAQSVQVHDVAEQLGVRYVVEGSLQRAAKGYRVNVHLIDAIRGTHMWAQRYDRGLADVDEFLQLQDEIVNAVCAELDVRLSLSPNWRAALEDVGDFELWRKLLEWRKYHSAHTQEAHRRAEELAAELLEECPDAPISHVCMGWVMNQKLNRGWTDDRAKAAAEAIKHAEAALARRPIASAHALLASVNALTRNYEQALRHCTDATDLAASAESDSSTIALVGWVYYVCGRIEEGISLLNQAMRADPHCPHWIPLTAAVAMRAGGRLSEAKAIFETLVSPDVRDGRGRATAALNLAIIAVREGRPDRAEEWVRSLLQSEPGWTIPKYRKAWGRRHPHNKDEYERCVEDLVVAGLPAD